MNKLLNIFIKFKVIILISLLLILISIGLVHLYNTHFRYYIFVKFAESGPLYKGMPVCYKGCNIGRTEEVTLSPDYKYTLVKIIIYPKNPKLPEDVVGTVKKHDVLRNYIDLINQEQPSTTILKKGGTIEGKGIFDMGSFLSDIEDSGLLIPLIQNFSDTALSLTKTSSEIKNFFSDSRLVIKDNRQNLKQTTTDMATTTKSFKKLSSKFNNSITDDKLNNTTSSINKSSTNILTVTEDMKKITGNIDNATKNLDKTVAKVDCTISNANAVATNARVITGGIREVMGKRFAGLRIFFGKPLDKNGRQKNCSK